MFKKIFLGIAFAATLSACNENFEDWVAPQTNAEPTTVSFGDGSVAEVGVIDLNNLQDGQTMVQVANITAPSASKEGYNANYTITLGDQTYDINNAGEMVASELNDYVHNQYGFNPVQREIEAKVSMWLNDGITSVKTATSAAFKVKAIGVAPVIESAYYLVGSMNGWDNTNTEYEMTNGGGDVYANPVFSITIPAPADGSGLEFKVFPKSSLGNWDNCLANSETEGKFEWNNAGGNFSVPAVDNAKYYTISFNILEQTWSAKALCFDQFVYFIGATDGWSASEQKLESANFDGVYTGYIYVADPNGWGLAGKFQRVAGSWDNQISAGNTTCLEGVTGSDNFEFPAEAVYYITLDLVKNTIKAVQVNNMNLVGAFNGWNQADDAQQMTWDAENYCFVKENAGVNAEGWKFTINNEWGINLGGTIDNLVANGDNLGVAGSTVKLYPTRRNSDKIYCTVE